MADLDDIKGGKSYGIGVETPEQKYFLKGCSNLEWGMKDRLSRIFNPASKRTVMLAFDHGFIMGPTSGLERVDLHILPLTAYADCLMCSRGILRTVIPPTLNKPVCLRSDAGSTILTDLNDNVLIDMEDAVRLNASAMAVMVAVGDAKYEASTIANLYKAVDMGIKYGLPVMGVTSVGKDMVRDSKYFGLAARVCAENGAHIVKTYYVDDFEKVVAACPVPIVIAGGKKLPELEALELAYNAINCGASGVDMGRNIFQSENPTAMIQAVRAVVHEGRKPAEAFELYKTLK
jgi:putative autoinducer-2 (AI-2) aldolase